MTLCILFSELKTSVIIYSGFLIKASDKMYSTYRLNANELNNNFLDGLKEMFKDKNIEIIVTEYDETEYLLGNDANKKRLLEAIDNVNSGKNLIEADSKIFQ